MTRNRIVLLIAVVGLALAPAMAEAKGGPKAKGGPPAGKGWKKGPGKAKGPKWNRGHGNPGRGNARGRFSARDVDIIRRFYGSRRPGCARSLPPGIRKNVARGKPVPPGLRRRYGCRLPQSLLARLPRRPGYYYYLLGDQLLLISRTTNLIADIARRLI
jgi:Ni/Co efflux regulator RcnB